MGMRAAFLRTSSGGTDAQIEGRQIMKRNKKPLRVAVVDFFAGCGGASYGFKTARAPSIDVTVLAGIDNDPYCCRTYERMISAPAHLMDIRELVEQPAKLSTLLAPWKLRSY